MRGSASERGFFGAAGEGDPAIGVKPVDVRRIEIQAAGKRAQLLRLRQAGVRVVGGHFRQLDRRFHQALDAFRGEIGSVRRSGALANQNAQPGPRASRPLSGSPARASVRWPKTSSPSSMVHSASPAPAASARRTTSRAISPKWFSPEGIITG